MGAAPEIVVDATAAELAEDVAARVVATLVAAQAARPLAHLVVTGGGILEQVMAALRELPTRDSVDWSRVALWWGDERYVPADSDDRNDRAAFTKLFDALSLDPANVHRMPAADGPFGDDVEAAAAAYAAELGAAADLGSDVPRFDAVLLGIGPDGHCASLFPGYPGPRVNDAAVIAVHDSPKPPPTRISLTFGTLDAADEVWFIASGSSKAHAVALAFSGASPEQVPAAGPHGRRRTLWLLDQQAAADLPADRRPPTA
ncbi:MAG TPA: 6-phosphogluconolactonase [Jatrophihabitantaceae bacterium]|jgi:6-phosphogluconolactonase